MDAQRRITQILNKPGNRDCADCGGRNPRWISITLGVVVCIKCCGHHRKLGVHISKMKSVTLDTWNDQMLSTMERLDNDIANRYWEHSLDRGKPNENSSTHTVETFIRNKYERRMWAARDNPDPVTWVKNNMQNGTQEEQKQGNQRQQQKPVVQAQPQPVVQQKPQAPVPNNVDFISGGGNNGQWAQWSSPQPAPQKNVFQNPQPAQQSGTSLFPQSSQPAQFPSGQQSTFQAFPQAAPVQQFPQPTPAQPPVQQFPANPAPQFPPTPPSQVPVQQLPQTSAPQFPQSQPQPFQQNPPQFPQQTPQQVPFNPPAQNPQYMPHNQQPPHQPYNPNVPYNGNGQPPAQPNQNVQSKIDQVMAMYQHIPAPTAQPQGFQAMGALAAQNFFSRPPQQHAGYGQQWPTF